jgi:hypothetical protein
MSYTFKNPFMPDLSLRPDGMVFGGGKGGGGSKVVEKPVYVPPPAAPQLDNAATQEDAVTPEDEMMRQKESIKKGAKSLQIPLAGSGDGGATGTIGTGSDNK